MTAYDVAALGNAIVDVISPADDAFLTDNGLARGAMTLIDEDRAHALYARMGAGVEASGGSAGNTVAGVASLGGRAAYIGKVANDPLGEVFAHDLRAGGVAYSTPPLVGGAATARCLISVTPDGQRTMSTYLGASVALTPADVDEAMIKGAQTTFLEGYLFDPDGGRQAFAKAATIARDSGRRVALTLSDVFVVERHRAGLRAFLDSVDVLFANEGEAMALCETDDLDTALSLLGERVEIAAVTRGERGSVILAGGQATEVPAATIQTLVDTTGAGDQYAAGFLFGIARGLPMRVCGQLGSLAAAEVIQHFGPRPMTSLAELAQAQGLPTGGRRLMTRVAEVVRETKETQIRVRLDLDGTGASTVSTGIGFFDHMLEAFARHGGIDAQIETRGDLHIDMHHTVEDTGIAIGQAVAKALDGPSGRFGGVRRFGHAYVPMDETLTRCSLDLSNRPYLVWKVAFNRPKIGEFDTELFKEFHHAFAMNAGACVHLETLYGENSHHIAESGFKALARALRAAVEIDPKAGGQAVSTKGVL